MIEISFLKILVVLLVALIVLGPERTPIVAKTLGRMVGKIRYFLNEAQKEFTKLSQEKTKDN